MVGRLLLPRLQGLGEVFVFEEHSRLILVGDDNSSRRLEPRLPIHLHGNRVFGAECEFGHATLPQARVLDA